MKRPRAVIKPADVARVLNRIGMHPEGGSALPVFTKRVSESNCQIVVHLPKRTCIQVALRHNQNLRTINDRIKRVQRTKGWEDRLVRRVQSLENLLKNLPRCKRHYVPMVPRVFADSPTVLSFVCSLWQEGNCDQSADAAPSQSALVRRELRWPRASVPEPVLV